VTKRWRLLIWSVLLVGGGGVAIGEKLIVRTPKPYAGVEQKIVALGGVVTYELKHADGLAVTVPDDKVDALKALPEVLEAVRDTEIPNPKPKEVVDVTGDMQSLIAADAVPANYFTYNVELTNALPLQDAGFNGQGVVVGLIDSGTSATAAALGGRVIGGENLVPGATEPGATAANNDPHGTWVACMIGADAFFGFAHSSTLATSLRNNCNPVSSFPCALPVSATLDAVGMVGQAPLARFFALKVFPAAGGGAPTSRILQAMDRAIDLKNTTMPDMRVVNMSLGGENLYAGHDLTDELAASMADAGITLTASSGNAGPSGTTIGHPGSAIGILTVGAANSVVHERVLRDLQFGLGIGALYRPDPTQQMAYFSSRGPNADGRNGPEVVANGFASFAQGANGGISLVSGTSFSSPTLAGIAAALYSAAPSATPADIRAVIIRSARPDVIPTAGAVDQGAGYVDAAGALALLQSGVAPVGDPGVEKKKVSQNVQQGAGIQPIEASSFTTHVADLAPSERRDFYYTVKKNTAAVRVTLTHIRPSLPPAQQNQLFGDDVLLAVHSAKTSAIGEGDYLAFNFIVADSSFLFPSPETGLMRVTVNGDWTNAGNVSADVRIEETVAPLSKKDFKGKVSEGELVSHTFNVPAGTASITFQLSWDSDWGAYPTDDLDMFLISPGGSLNANGATDRSPEIVTIANPQPGTWTIFVDGFTVFGKDDKYVVRVD
jgi:serine protease AprX